MLARMSHTLINICDPFNEYHILTFHLHSQIILKEYCKSLPPATTAKPLITPSCYNC